MTYLNAITFACKDTFSSAILRPFLAVSMSPCTSHSMDTYFAIWLCEAMVKWGAMISRYSNRARASAWVALPVRWRSKLAFGNVLKMADVILGGVPLSRRAVCWDKGDVDSASAWISHSSNFSSSMKDMSRTSSKGSNIRPKRSVPRVASTL